MIKLVTLLIALSLTACATTSIDAGKSLALAWQGLDAASISADAAVRAGKLSGVNASVVAADLRKASDALQVATSAYGTSASSNAAAQIAVATTATAEIVSIIAGIK